MTTPTIYIIGDSTASNKRKEARPETGWGECLATYFQDQITIDNLAVNGRSTRSFIQEGQLEALEYLIHAGDYLLIQFGHNDQKIEDPNRYTTIGDYQKNLRLFIEVARKQGATPILLTSVTRRQFDGDQISPLSVGEYPQATLAVAASENVVVLDIHQRSRHFFNQLGPEASKPYFMHLAPHIAANYPEGLADDTHLSPLGAQAVAQIVVTAIKENASSLNHYLNHQK